MKTTVKTAGAVLGAAMMATAGIAGAVPAFADEAPAGVEAQAAEAGGAVANAEASGVSLASVAAMMGA